jgi:peptidoglycan-associated lipoprotein
MVRKKNRLWIIMFAIMLLVFMSGCAAFQKKQALTPEEERAAQEKQAKTAQEEQKKKSFEQSLAEKKYPGIEGQVWESTLLQDIHFDFDRYDLTEEARRLLTENATVLANHPSLKIQIEGHCDERGNSAYNLALGERRATSAKLYLMKLGVQEDRLSTISYGKERPLDPGHTEEAWAKNRRCHFVILSR